MKTTITIDDDLLTRAERTAVVSGRTLSEVVEEALRAHLIDRPQQPPFERRLVTFGGGGVLPGVDMSNNAAVRDVMDGLV